MANVRKGHIVKPSGMSSWWKHLRAYGKRQFWKQHRKAEKRLSKETGQ